MVLKELGVDKGCGEKGWGDGKDRVVGRKRAGGRGPRGKGGREGMPGMDSHL